jgi:hypothetical protein
MFMVSGLVAVRHLTIGNYEYRPGDILPPVDNVTAMEWTVSGVAKIAGAAVPEGGAGKKKAKRLTAPAGRTGIAVPSSGPDVDLVGHVPPPTARGVVREPSTRPGKKSKK